jgi:energy-coupling factor transport system substrate-specific component
MKLNVKEIAVFGMLGALMYASKLIMELLPNIHLLGVFVIAITAVYRKKALYPIYIYVFINGLAAGFAAWWFAYLYVWTILWGATMLLPKNMPPKVAPIVYMVLCALHGFLFGTLCAPAQALFFGFDFKQTIAWIVAGFSFDAIHGISNLLCGALICPIIAVLKRAERYTG